MDFLEEIKDELIDEVVEYLDNLIECGYELVHKNKYKASLLLEIFIAKNLEQYPQIYVGYSISDGNLHRFYTIIMFSFNHFSEIKHSNSLEELFDNIQERINEIGIEFHGNPILK